MKRIPSLTIFVGPEDIGVAIFVAQDYVVEGLQAHLLVVGTSGDGPAHQEQDAQGGKLEDCAV